MMADRKNKHAYLDDFEKDLNGNYQYRGAHYHYKGTQPRGKALAGLWVLCGGGTACLLAAGFVHGATAHAPFWLLLPYMAGLLAGVYVLYLLVRRAVTRCGLISMNRPHKNCRVFAWLPLYLQR